MNQKLRKDITATLIVLAIAGFITSIILFADYASEDAKKIVLKISLYFTLFISAVGIWLLVRNAID